MLLLTVSSFAQNKQLLYGFNEIPQILLLNPGSEVNYNYHFGVPLLSGASLNVGSSGFSVYDLLKDDGVDINAKVKRLINELERTDFVNLNQQLDILNMGFRINDNNYISLGFYQELDVIMYYPKDYMKLFYEGNAESIDKRFLASSLTAKGEMLGVLHGGISHKVNQKLTIGSRFKIYSGALNFKTGYNSGVAYTILGEKNIYNHYLENLDLTVYSAGFEFDNEGGGASGLLGKMMFGGNLGFGVDLGLTYRFNDQIEITASVQDIGFVHNSKDVETQKITGDFAIEGVEVVFDAKTPDGRWGDLEGEFVDKVKREVLRESYTSWRSPKMNTTIKYSFGKSIRRNLYYTNFRSPYDQAFGAQFYAIARPLNPQLAATLFYEKSFGNKFRTKFSYTADPYSYKNIGIGASSRIGNLNWHLLADNLLDLYNVTQSRSFSIQFGLNFIIDDRFK